MIQMMNFRRSLAWTPYIRQAIYEHIKVFQCSLRRVKMMKIHRPVFLPIYCPKSCYSIRDFGVLQLCSAGGIDKLWYFGDWLYIRNIDGTSPPGLCQWHHNLPQF